MKSALNSFAALRLRHLADRLDQEDNLDNELVFKIADIAAKLNKKLKPLPPQEKPKQKPKKPPQETTQSTEQTNDIIRA